MPITPRLGRLAINKCNPYRERGREGKREANTLRRRGEDIGYLGLM